MLVSCDGGVLILWSNFDKFVFGYMCLFLFFFILWMDSFGSARAPLMYDKNVSENRMRYKMNCDFCIGFLVKPMHFSNFILNFKVNTGSKLGKCTIFIIIHASVKTIIFLLKKNTDKSIKFTKLPIHNQVSYQKLWSNSLFWV